MKGDLRLLIQSPHFTRKRRQSVIQWLIQDHSLSEWHTPTLWENVGSNYFPGMCVWSCMHGGTQERTWEYFMSPFFQIMIQCISLRQEMSQNMEKSGGIFIGGRGWCQAERKQNFEKRLIVAFQSIAELPGRVEHEIGFLFFLLKRPFYSCD